jgi:hypothetical protein
MVNNVLLCSINNTWTVGERWNRESDAVKPKRQRPVWSTVTTEHTTREEHDVFERGSLLVLIQNRGELTTREKKKGFWRREANTIFAVIGRAKTWQNDLFPTPVSQLT